MGNRLKRSKFVWIAGSIALCAPLASAAALMPPAIPMPVVVVADDPEAQAGGEALVTVLRELGWFADAPAIDRAALQDCLQSKDNRETCIRKLDGWKSGDAAVVVLAEGTPLQSWSCIGVASTAKSPGKQAVSIDLREALFGDPAKRFEIRNKASSCIMAAGSESGW